MTDWLPSDFSLPALLLRTLGTAAVVVGAGWLLHAGAAYLALDQGPGRALALFALLTAAAGV